MGKLQSKAKEWLIQNPKQQLFEVEGGEEDRHQHERYVGALKWSE